MKTLPIIVEEISRPETVWRCPHCLKVIEEKSLYRDASGQWFHRTCPDPVTLPPSATSSDFSALSALKSASAMSRPLTIRTIHPEVRIVSESEGLVDYVASDETLDSYREIIRADGWQFTNFAKNAPFADSHRYDSIADLLGKVVDFRVVKRKLVERVQWAKDIPGTLAEWGWKMTVGGFLRAVSVGFIPLRAVTASEPGWQDQLVDLGLDPAKTDTHPRRVFLRQEQYELSACIIGANPNALALAARAYRDGCLTEQDIDLFSARLAELRTTPARQAPGPVAASQATTRRAAHLAILAEIQAQL